MKTKPCTHRGHKGRRELPLAGFSLHPKTRDGRQSICKACNARLAYARSAKRSEQRRREKGQDPMKRYREEAKAMTYREAPADYKEEISPDVLLRDL